MTKTHRHLIISLLLIAVTVGFIWLNSALSGADSSALSGKFRAVLETVLKLLHFPAAQTEFLLTYVRKVAHAVEYAVIGAELGFLWAGLGKRFQGLWNAFSTVLTISVLDETIQLFADSRGPQITDVLLDTASGIAGILVVYLLFYITKRIEK